MTNIFIEKKLPINFYSNFDLAMLAFHAVDEISYNRLLLDLNNTRIGSLLNEFISLRACNPMRRGHLFQEQIPLHKIKLILKIVIKNSKNSISYKDTEVLLHYYKEESCLSHANLKIKKLKKDKCFLSLIKRSKARFKYYFKKLMKINIEKYKENQVFNLYFSYSLKCLNFYLNNLR